MVKSSLRIACLLAMLAAPLAAQQTHTDVPPEPRADSPRTFAERASPTTFGATVIPGSDGHLRVSAIDDGSAAAQAGLRVDDHIVSVNGQLLTESDAFNTYIAARPASPLNFVVLRHGKQETIIVHPASAATIHESHSRPALGVRFMQSPQVVIAETVAGSPAAAAGLAVGDQIITVNDDVVTSSDQFITLVAATPLNESLTLGYLRGAERNTVTLAPAAWDEVFASTGTYTTLKPVAPSVAAAPVVTYPAYAYPFYNPYYISNVSPVVVPLAWYGYYPYGYAYWNYPYYSSYYPGYFYYGSSPYWYYAWPYGPRYGGPYPGPVHSKPAAEVDSAGQRLPSGDRTVSRVVDQPDA